MKNLIASLFILLLFASIGCNPDDELLQKRSHSEVNPSNTSTGLFADNSADKELELFGGKEICGQIIEKPMLSNGNFIGGSLFIANTEDQLLFKFVPVEGWQITEVNLYFGSLVEIPASQSGNPQFSEFANTYIYNPPLPEVSVPFDLLDIEIEDDGNITIVAHAKITDGDELDPAVKSIIAQWDDDDLLFLGPRRGGGFLYEIQSCDIDPYGASGDDDAVSGMEDELLVDPLCVNPDQWSLFNKKNDPDQVEILGEVEFSTDAENMIFSFSVEPDWMISSIHVNVGDFDGDQFNASGNVPKGRYDFSMSYEPAEVATIEDPLEFPVQLLEIEEDLDENGCGKFYVQATLYQEVYENDILISITQSVSIAWSENLNASSRHGGGSLAGGSQGGGSGSQGGGSVDPASMILCLDVCTTE